MVTRILAWPAALLIKWIFERGAVRISKSLAKHLPPTVIKRGDIQYIPDDTSASLDIFYPVPLKNDAFPIIVWVHGGAWISGSKENVAAYAAILSAEGYAVATVNYSLAPMTTYPKPVEQVNAALGYLCNNAGSLSIDPSQIILAGDSAGAQIAAQVANIISSEAYSTALKITPKIKRIQLRGVVLFCGAFDLSLAGGRLLQRWFIHTVLWSYTGTRNYLNDSRFQSASVAHFVESSFPPAFISAGNNDPLLAQSVQFARSLRAVNVRVDSLFFDPLHKPASGHEYQFDLDNPSGREALSRLKRFLLIVTGNQ